MVEENIVKENLNQMLLDRKYKYVEKNEEENYMIYCGIFEIFEGNLSDNLKMYSLNHIVYYKNKCMICTSKIKIYR